MLVFLLFRAGQTMAQTHVPDSAGLQLNEVVITGIQGVNRNETPFNISVFSREDLYRDIHYNVSDALSKMPGVSQLTSGPGISKPVIRGLYGNRIQTVVMGIKFDNQQWQDEHGLGLSLTGIDHIEILKGPSSLLYGTDAMGGVINIIEEKAAPEGSITGDASATLFSNTLGSSAQVGFRGNNGRTVWRIHAGADSHADYSDGNNQRVLNSRFNSYNVKASLGFRRKNWENLNHVFASFSQFGFITESNQDKKPLDGRFSRTMDGPNHSVFFLIVSTENKIRLKSSLLKVNGGFHNNIRLENEGGNKISLNMQLNTATYNVRWFKQLRPRLEFVAGHELQFQTNRNYGSRVIIPDADCFQASALVYLSYHTEKLFMEAGLSIHVNNIRSYHTQGMNYESGAIYPLNLWLPSGNGNFGVSWNPVPQVNIKLNVSTGYRAPNLAELSSNGLHEGTYRWEIGDPDMKIEQNFNPELGINYETPHLKLHAAAFSNYFLNYIYLSPTGTEYIGFSVYRFLQKDAFLYGGEADMTISPVRFFSFTSAFSTVTGQTTDGLYLPFIPANKWTNEIEFKGALSKTIQKAFVKAGVEYYFAQDHPGQFEASTPGYYLLNASLGATFRTKRVPVTVSLSARNILNATYYDHLSRFKYYGIYNLGRNFSFTVAVPFTIRQQRPVNQ